MTVEIAVDGTKRIGFYSRDEEYGWLSNFWRAKQVDESGIEYPTNEHYYQSQKTSDPEVAKWIREAPKPYLAMKAGRFLRPQKELRDDWEQVKVAVMAKGLHMKFSQNPDLKAKLLATGEAFLYETSDTDAFWGGKLKGSKNMLGELLMLERNKLAMEEDLKDRY